VEKGNFKEEDLDLTGIVRPVGGGVGKKFVDWVVNCILGPFFGEHNESF